MLTWAGRYKVSTRPVSAYPSLACPAEKLAFSSSKKMWKFLCEAGQGLVMTRKGLDAVKGTEEGQ